MPKEQNGPVQKPELTVIPGELSKGSADNPRTTDTRHYERPPKTDSEIRWDQKTAATETRRKTTRRAIGGTLIAATAGAALLTGVTLIRGGEDTAPVAPKTADSAPDAPVEAEAPKPTKKLSIQVYTDANPSSIVNNAERFHLFHDRDQNGGYDQTEKDAAYTHLVEQQNQGAFNNVNPAKPKYVDFQIAADQRPHVVVKPGEDISKLALSAQHLGLPYTAGEINQLLAEDGQAGAQADPQTGGETIFLDYGKG